jgi:hypothetical protein
MKAEITAPHGFRAAPDGHTVVLFETGHIVEGWIAEDAVIAGAARRIDDIADSLEYKDEAAPSQIEPRRRGRPRKVIE